MNTHQAVMAYSQSEKIKSSLIWATQLAEQTLGFRDPPQPNTGVLLRSLVGMIAQESSLAHRLTADNNWVDVTRSIDMAAVMIESGVIQEAPFHLTKALSQTTSIAQRAMTFLRENGVLDT